MHPHSVPAAGLISPSILQAHFLSLLHFHTVDQLWSGKRKPLSLILVDARRTFWQKQYQHEQYSVKYTVMACWQCRSRSQTSRGWGCSHGLPIILMNLPEALILGYEGSHPGQCSSVGHYSQLGEQSVSQGSEGWSRNLETTGGEWKKCLRNSQSVGFVYREGSNRGSWHCFIL